MPIAEDLVRHAVDWRRRADRDPSAPDFVNQWVSWGAGLRAGQSLVLGAKARALLAGAVPRRARRHPGAGASRRLRHRILLGYRAEADGVTVDSVIDRLA